MYGLKFVQRYGIAFKMLVRKGYKKYFYVKETMHGVKGMEFKNVFIINCNEEFIPHSKSLADNLEEERRVFYVAITRAIDNLSLCTVESIKGKAKIVSRFIEECRV